MWCLSNGKRNVVSIKEWTNLLHRDPLVGFQTLRLGVGYRRGSPLLKGGWGIRKWTVFLGENRTKKTAKFGAGNRVLSFLDTRVTISAGKSVPLYVFKPCGCKVFNKKRLAFSGGKFYRFK